MELRTLKTFVMVAELQNFSAAARALHTVQPAVSRQISELEQQLGARLLWRNTREVRITEAGQVLLTQAREILQKAGQVKELVRLAAHGETGELKIGYMGSPCINFLPGLICRYSELYPQVKIRLQEMTAQKQLEAFDRNELDIGFSRPLPINRQRTLAAEQLLLDKLYIVLPESHPLNTGEPVALAQLEAENLILFKREEAIGLFDQIITSCQQQGFSPVISSQPDNMQTLLTEVAAGLGVSIVPGCVENLISTGCHFATIKDLNIEVPLELHFRREQCPQVAQRFRQLVHNLRDQSKLSGASASD